jgi:hypothetical protein
MENKLLNILLKKLNLDIKNVDKEKIHKLDYNEGIQFVIQIVNQLQILIKKGYYVSKLSKNDIEKVYISNSYEKNYYFIIKNFKFFLPIKKSDDKELIIKQMYYMLANLCLDLMSIKNIKELEPSKLYYMLKRMTEKDLEKREYIFI